MSKKRILWFLTVLSVLSLNFISHEKADEVINNTSYEAYKEYFDNNFPTGYTVKDKRFPLKHSMEITSKMAHEPLLILCPYGDIEAKPKFNVSATIYKALHPMTDLTASGIKLDTVKAGKHRIIAVSRDLMKNGLSFGSKVFITGTGTHDGVWIVQDLMHQKWRNRIDFLSDADARNNKWKNITMIKLD